MLSRKWLALLAVLVIASILFAACGPAPTPEVVEVEVEKVVTQIVQEMVEVEKEVTKIVEGTPEIVTVIETQVVEQEVEVVVTATPEPAPEPTATIDASSPQQSRVIEIANAYNLRGCDMHKRGNSTTHQQACGAPILDTLITLDAKGPMVPSLAESWEVSEDGTVYTFNLRQDVKFHDGTDFNAEAVKINFERIMDPDTGAVMQAVFSNITSIETPDDYTVVVTLETPDINFPIALVQFSTGIYSPAALEEYGDDIDTNPVGTGPFKFVSFLPEDQRHERNEDYWGGAPYLEGMHVQVIPDHISRMLALESGTVDAALWVPEVEIDRLVEAGFNMQSEPGQNWTAFNLNPNNPPLDDIRVRQAIMMALDREAFMEPVWHGRAIVNRTGLPPESPYFDESIEPWEYNPERAMELLEEAGWMPTGSGGIREKDGELLELYFPVGADIPRPQVALIAQDQLRQVGIALDVSVIETFSFYEKTYNCEHDMTYSSNSFITLDPALYFNDFHSENANVPWCFPDPELDALIEEGRSITDEARRQEVYSEIQQMLIDKATVGWLAHYESPSAVLQPYVQDWYYPLYRIFRLTPTWLAE
jgi:peptide/nickel transport system substrate-binding protein